MKKLTEDSEFIINWKILLIILGVFAKLLFWAGFFVTKNNDKNYERLNTKIEKQTENFEIWKRESFKPTVDNVKTIKSDVSDMKGDIKVALDRTNSRRSVITAPLPSSVSNTPPQPTN